MRRVLFPDESKLVMQLPVRTMGVKISLTAEQIEPIRKLDLFFLQGGSPQNNSFMYISGAWRKKKKKLIPSPCPIFFLCFLPTTALSIACIAHPLGSDICGRWFLSIFFSWCLF